MPGTCRPVSKTEPNASVLVVETMSVVPSTGWEGSSRTVTRTSVRRSPTRVPPPGRANTPRPSEAVRASATNSQVPITSAVADGLRATR